MPDAAAVIHGHVHQRQRVIESLSERSGSIGNRQPGSTSSEQRNSDLGLEGPHSLADSTWCDAQFSGGQREIAMPDTGSQDTQ